MSNVKLLHLFESIKVVPVTVISAYDVINERDVNSYFFVWRGDFLRCSKN